MELVKRTGRKKEKEKKNQRRLYIINAEREKRNFVTPV